MQRLRLKFGCGEEVKFISHLDTMRFWERAFRRAEMPLAYSEGFSPHPRISVAAPLAVGVTSGAELMDIWLKRWMPPQSVMMVARGQLPPGFAVFDAREVGLTLPSLQSCLAFAEYRVEVGSEESEQWVRDSIHSLLQTRELPWQHSRGSGKIHFYDLRALIDSLWLIHCRDSLCILGMRLQCNSSGSGRPEQVTAALGFSLAPESIHRTGLVLKGMSAPL
ncbi:MAG: TIGR03936 family radical SAM-associated protein [Chloroflexota bacterium]|nr:TIGR03936 family radical SAM-associated protein [Chloroflexota bacterium]